MYPVTPVINTVCSFSWLGELIARNATDQQLVIEPNSYRTESQSGDVRPPSCSQQRGKKERFPFETNRVPSDQVSGEETFPVESEWFSFLFGDASPKTTHSLTVSG
jgi:hypothetical protein